MLSAAQKAVDWSNRHTIDLARVEAGQVANVTALLTELDGKLTSMLLGSGVKPGKVDKLTVLQGAAAAAIGKTYAGISSQQGELLKDVAKMEAKAVGQMFNSQVGVDVFGPVLTENQWSKVANQTLVFGHKSGDWWKSQDQALRFKFAGQIQEGYAMGESVDEMVRRIRGTKANNYSDGIMVASKRDAAALVRSSVQTISNAARLAGFEQNQDIIKGVQWVATFDGRTTVICIALNGLMWRLPDYEPIGHDKAFPGPVAHWGCRSTQIAVMRSWAELSGKPIKALDQATLQEKLQAKLAAKGMAPDQAAKAMANAKASMDGQIADSTTHDQWLSSIGDKRASALLGPGRYALWKAGKLQVRDLTNQDNRPLTIKQLEAAIDGGGFAVETEGVEFLPTATPTPKFAPEGNPLAIAWQPTMTPEDAAAWAGPGGIDALHVTTDANAALIVQNGFKLGGTGGVGGGALGNGIYLMDPDGSLSPSTMAKLPAKLSVKIRGGKLANAEDFIAAKDALGIDVPGGLMNATDEQRAAMSAYLQGKGFIGVNPGSEFVIFDPKDLVVIDPKAPKAKLLPSSPDGNETEAAGKIADILANPKGQTLKAAALAKLQKEEPGLTPSDMLAKAEGIAAEKQAAASKASVLSQAKKKLVAGDTPTQAQWKLLNSLPVEEQNAFLASVEEGKQASTAMIYPEIEKAISEQGGKLTPDQVAKMNLLPGDEVKYLTGKILAMEQDELVKELMADLSEPGDLKGNVEYDALPALLKQQVTDHLYTKKATADATNQLADWANSTDPLKQQAVSQAGTQLQKGLQSGQSSVIDQMDLAETIYVDMAVDKLVEGVAGPGATKLKQAAFKKATGIDPTGKSQQEVREELFDADLFTEGPEILLKVETEAAEKQAAASKASKLSTAKAKIVAGKKPSPSEQATIDALTPEEAVNFEEAVKNAKAVATADAAGKLTVVEDNKPVATASGAQDLFESDAYKAKIDKLSKAEKEAFYEYTLSDNTIMTPFLKGTEYTHPGTAKDFIPKIEALDKLLDKFQLEQAVVVKRGIGKTDPLYTKAIDDLVGSVHEEKGFLSTTIKSSPDKYFADGAELEIHLPAGIKAAYVESVSGNKGEQELLLQRGLKFEILSVDVMADGRRKIVMVAQIPPAKAPPIVEGNGKGKIVATFIDGAKPDAKIKAALAKELGFEPMGNAMEVGNALDAWEKASGKNLGEVYEKAAKIKPPVNKPAGPTAAAPAASPTAQLKAVFASADQSTKAQILDAIGGDVEGFMASGGALSDDQWIDDTIDALTEMAEDNGDTFLVGPSLKAAQDLVAQKLAAKAAVQPVTKTTTKPDITASNLDLYIPNPKTLVKVKDLPGSTKPYLASDPATGKQWVVKTSGNGLAPAHLRSEALADAIYRAAGAPVPGSDTVSGGPVVFKIAEYLDGGETLAAWQAKATPAQREEMRKQISERFVLDALLGNWDVAGLSNDNILVVGGKAIRIDNGGALFFRAQGAPKAFGPEVTELKTLRDPGTNSTTAAIFGGITDDDINRQIVEVLSRREQILEAADRDPKVKQALADRMAWLESQLPPSAKPDATAARKAWEQIPPDIKTKVEKARINGTAIPVGTTDVEDMQALVWREQAVDGTDRTVVHLKITEKGEAAIKKAVGTELAKAAKPVTNGNTGTLDDPYLAKFQSMAKTLATHAVDKAYNAGTVANFESAYQAAKADFATLTATKSKTAVQKAQLAQIEHYLKIAADLKDVKDGNASNIPWVNQFAGKVTDYKDDKVKAKAAPAAPAAFTVTKATHYKPRRTELVNGRAVELPEFAGNVPVDAGVYMLKFPDGTEVTYIPRTGRRADTMNSVEGVALEGLVEVNMPITADIDTVGKALQKLREMGIDTTAADADYREAVWLAKTVAVHNDQNKPAWQAIQNLPTLPEQIKAGREFIEKTYKVKVPERGQPGYTADGEANVYGAGLTKTYRADLTRAEAEKQMAGYYLQHTSSRALDQVIDGFLNSGGEVTTTTNRLRKGISVMETGGISATTDLTTGGASFFFTRIRKASDTQRNALLFKIGNIARADAVTYPGDFFGATSKIGERKSTVKEFISVAASGRSDETILKDGLFFLSEIDLIQVDDQAYRQRVLAVFKKHGIWSLPDGRKIEDVVVVK